MIPINGGSSCKPTDRKSSHGSIGCGVSSGPMPLKRASAGRVQSAESPSPRGIAISQPKPVHAVQLPTLRPNGHQNPVSSAISPGRSANRRDVETLWRQGITRPGMRVETTKQIAWHLIFKRRMPEQEAADELVRWVYDTGKETSADVMVDLRNDTRKVEDQTREIVAWMAMQLRESGAAVVGRFSVQELDAILGFVMQLPPSLRACRARFAIDFLNFAKRCGKRVGEGWECRPAVRGVIRKWDGCSGTRYKAHLDWAREVGLISMTREKWQARNGRGRARTYVIHVPSSDFPSRTLSYSNAIEYASRQLGLRGQ